MQHMYATLFKCGGKTKSKPFKKVKSNTNKVTFKSSEKTKN